MTWNTKKEYALTKTNDSKMSSLFEKVGNIISASKIEPHSDIQKYP